MKKILTQHCTKEQQVLLDVSQPTNMAYAKELGYEYIIDSKKRCQERSVYWEKIAWLIELLGKTEDDSLVVWEDVDSINIKNEDFITALPTGGIFGMVQNRAGVDCKQLIPWYNAGVLVMINSKIVRDFLNRVWDRNDTTDEEALNAELKHNGWIVGDGIRISSIDPKWNCWVNNAHLCKEVVVQSWHGVPFEKKCQSIKKFMVSNDRNDLGFFKNANTTR